MATSTAPLHIDRVKLIERLQEVKAEAEAKRQEAIDSAKASRKALLDLAAQLTPDQVANLVDHFTCTCDAVKWFEDVIENEKFVSQDAKVTAVETAVEKQIRVLELAVDTSVEVQPQDSLYAYL